MSRRRVKLRKIEDTSNGQNVKAKSGILFITVQFRYSVMSTYLWSHEQQDARLPYPSPIPGACSNSSSSSRWCYPPSHPLLPLLLPPSIFPSIRVFSNESALCIKWPKYWSFSFSINPSNEHSGLISFRTDWLDLLSVQGTLKSLLQHQRSKASIIQQLAFFIIQMSHPYITPGKTVALIRWAFVSKVISLLYNKLSRLVKLFFQGASIF